MADPATAAAASGAFSLKEAFNTVNHIRHWAMDISMIGIMMASMAALAASGGATGFLDPIWGWLKMHVAGIPDFFTAMPDFVSAAANSANQGVWFTGAEISHGAVHGGGAMPVTPEMKDYAEQATGVWGGNAKELAELQMTHE